MKSSCLNCKYYSIGYGECWRYPTPVLKNIDDFCGEFVAVDDSAPQLLNEDHDYKEML